MATLVTLVLSLAMAGVVYALSTIGVSGQRRSWFIFAGIVVCSSLVTVLGWMLTAPWVSVIVSVILTAVAGTILSNHHIRKERAQQKRELVMKSALEGVTDRLVEMAQEMMKLEHEHSRLGHCLAVRDEENKILRAQLSEYERRLKAVDWHLTFGRSLARLERRNRELEDLSRRDPLTRLYNRRYLDQVLESLAARDDVEALALALLDLDHFKDINDRFGHQVGDLVLTELAGLLRRHLREGDVAGRYGGEEFLVVLGCAETAWSVCEKLRVMVENHTWEHIVRDLRVTVSMGVAWSHRPLVIKRLIADADRCLYVAKAGGRNRVIAVTMPHLPD